MKIDQQKISNLKNRPKKNLKPKEQNTNARASGTVSRRLTSLRSPRKRREKIQAEKVFDQIKAEHLPIWGKTDCRFKAVSESQGGQIQRVVANDPQKR